MNSIWFLFCVCLLPAIGLCGPAVTVINSSRVFEDRVGAKENDSNQTTTNTEAASFVPLSVVKRDVGNEENEMYPQYPYPMIILKKSATVLNKLVHRWMSLDRSDPSNDNISGTSDEEYGKSTHRTLSSKATSARGHLAMDRRAQKERKVYLRCYFNAVSCFKK